MIGAARVLGRSASLSFYEFFGVYTPQAWLTAWVPRVVFGALFFALVAQFVGGRELLLFAIVGNAAYLTLQPTLTFTTGSVIREISGGSLPLLVASPTSALLVLTGRNAAYGVNGLISGALTIVTAGILGLPLSVSSFALALLLLVVIELSSYSFGLLLGALVVRYPASTNITPIVIGFALLSIGGVNIPLNVLPAAVQTVALALPSTHGLLALREALGAGDPGVLLLNVASELGIGAAYLTLAFIAFSALLRDTRRHGSLDYH